MKSCLLFKSTSDHMQALLRFPEIHLKTLIVYPPFKPLITKSIDLGDASSVVTIPRTTPLAIVQPPIIPVDLYVTYSNKDHIHNKLQHHCYTGPFLHSCLEYLIRPFHMSPLSTV